MKRFLFIALSFIALSPSYAQLAKIQFANNSADNAYPIVDIYVNGILFADDLPYRTATTYMDIAPGNVEVGVAPNNSLNVNDTFYSITSIVQPADTIFAILNGTETSTGYNPHMPFRIDALFGAQTVASDPNNTALMFIHGSTDMGTIDVRSGTSTKLDGFTLGDISLYEEFPTVDPVTFRITNDKGNKVYGTYQIAFQPYWQGIAGVMVTSGFLNPAVNNNGPALDVMLIPAFGGPFEVVNQTMPQPYSRVQFVHNSGDAMLKMVDVYVASEKVLDNVSYRTATAFIDAPAGQPVDIGIAKDNSNSVVDTFYNLRTTLDSAGSYIMFANGIESTSGYNPAPAFELKVFNKAKEEIATPTGNIDILFAHGSTDMPTLDLLNGTTAWMDKLSYSDVAPAYFSVPNNNYILKLQDGNGTFINNYNVPLKALGTQNKAITIVASGFKSPANNNNGDSFRLFMVPAEEGNFIPFAVEPVHIAEIATAHSFSIWPNPAASIISIDIKGYHTATLSAFDVTGKHVKTWTAISNNTVDISSLQQGLYILKMQADGATFYQKLTKQ